MVLLVLCGKLIITSFESFSICKVFDDLFSSFCLCSSTLPSASLLVLLLQWFLKGNLWRMYSFFVFFLLQLQVWTINSRTRKLKMSTMNLLFNPCHSCCIVDWCLSDLFPWQWDLACSWPFNWKHSGWGKAIKNNGVQLLGYFVSFLGHVDYYYHHYQWILLWILNM